MFAVTAQVVAAPRLRSWLTDSWDLSLRADRFLQHSFGIDRAPLPLADLARALADSDTARATDLLAAMRHAFQTDVRALCRAATCRSRLHPRRCPRQTPPPTAALK